MSIARPRAASATSGSTKRRKPRNQKWSRSARAVASSRRSIVISFVKILQRASRRQRVMRRGLRVFAAIALSAAIGASACAKKKPAPPPAAPPPPVEAPRTNPAPPPPPPTPPRETPPPTLTEDEIFARKSLDDLNREKPLGDAFFDLDSHQVRDDARPVLQKNAEWMKRWTSTKIMVEG